MNKERAIEILNNIIKSNEYEIKKLEERNKKMKWVTVIDKHPQERIQALDIAIDSLENEWVDVKDRLPKKEEKYYLVDTDYGIEIMKWHENPLAKTNNGNGWENKWEFKIDDFENKAYKERFINAWQPLPEPYVRSDEE